MMPRTMDELSALVDDHNALVLEVNRLNNVLKFVLGTNSLDAAQAVVKFAMSQAGDSHEQP